MQKGENKVERILWLYTKLMNGEWVDKQEEAMRYGVSERTIQRDISDIKAFLGNQSAQNAYIDDLEYEYGKGYHLKHMAENRRSCQ